MTSQRFCLRQSPKKKRCTKNTTCSKLATRSEFYYHSVIYYRGAPCVDTISLGHVFFLKKRRLQGVVNMGGGVGWGGVVKALRRDNLLFSTLWHKITAHEKSL